MIIQTFNCLLIASTPGVWGNGIMLLDVIWIEMPNGEEEPIYVNKYPNGYIRYSLMSGYTVIYDELLNDWCYAKQGGDGWLESSNFSIRLYTGKESGLKPGIRPTEARWNELEEKKESDDEQTRSFNSPWIPMPKTGSIQSIVIYVTLADAMFNNATFTDNGWFNGNSPAHSTKRYFQEVSRNHLIINFNFYSYRDTTEVSYFLSNTAYINGQPNTNGYSTFAEFENRVQQLRYRSIRGVAGQNISNSLFAI